MLKKILLLLCLGAFIAVAAIGCGEKEPKPTDENGGENGEENGGE